MQESFCSLSAVCSPSRVSDRISGIDLTMVGYILMGAGALGLALVLLLNGQRSRGARTTVVEEHREVRDPRDPRL